MGNSAFQWFTDPAKVVTFHSAEEAYRIFESGAAAGYLNQEYYCTTLSREDIEAFREIVRGSFESQAAETEEVQMTFYRL